MGEKDNGRLTSREPAVLVAGRDRRALSCFATWRAASGRAGRIAQVIEIVD
jgi:hypothetical protein